MFSVFLILRATDFSSKRVRTFFCGVSAENVWAGGGANRYFYTNGAGFFPSTIFDEKHRLHK